MSKRMLADVLWGAANSELSDGSTYGSYDERPTTYSCNAIAHALGLPEADALTEATVAFLASLGCDSKSCAMQFNSQSCEERQGVRYMWLLLAMHVAEDEGLAL